MRIRNRCGLSRKVKKLGHGAEERDTGNIAVGRGMTSDERSHSKALSCVRMAAVIVEDAGAMNARSQKRTWLAILNKSGVGCFKSVLTEVAWLRILWYMAFRHLSIHHQIFAMAAALPHSWSPTAKQARLQNTSILPAKKTPEILTAESTTKTRQTTRNAVIFPCNGRSQQKRPPSRSEKEPPDHTVFPS
jgi:hypothetical protein